MKGRGDELGLGDEGVKGLGDQGMNWDWEMRVKGTRGSRD